MEPDTPPTGRAKLFKPGNTPWRMLFGDGQTYWMMHQSQLASRIWHQAKPSTNKLKCDPRLVKFWQGISE